MRESLRKCIPIKRMSATVKCENGETKDDTDCLADHIIVDMTVKASVLIELAQPVVIHFRQKVLALLCYGCKQFEHLHKAFFRAQSKPRQFRLQLWTYRRDGFVELVFGILLTNASYFFVLEPPIHLRMLLSVLLRCQTNFPIPCSLQWFACRY